MSIMNPVRRVNVSQRMEAYARELIDEEDLNRLIWNLKHSPFNQEQRLWIAWKVSQIQAGRNIIAIAENGLNVMGVPSR